MFVFLPRTIEQPRELSYVQFEGEAKNLIKNSQPIQQYMKSIGKETTLENVISLSKTDKNFKVILDQELSNAGLLNQWQQFVTEFERRQAFETAKMATEVRQAARNVTKSADQIQDNQEYADRLGQKLNRMVRPRKAA